MKDINKVTKPFIFYFILFYFYFFFIRTFRCFCQLAALWVCPPVSPLVWQPHRLALLLLDPQDPAYPLEWMLMPCPFTRLVKRWNQLLVSKSEKKKILISRSCDSRYVSCGVLCVTESALDDLDLNDFGVSALERSLESSSALPSVGVMLGIWKHEHT